MMTARHQHKICDVDSLQTSESYNATIKAQGSFWQPSALSDQPSAPSSSLSASPDTSLRMRAQGSAETSSIRLRREPMQRPDWDIAPRLDVPSTAQEFKPCVDRIWPDRGVG